LLARLRPRHAALAFLPARAAAATAASATGSAAAIEVMFIRYGERDARRRQDTFRDVFACHAPARSFDAPLPLAFDVFLHFTRYRPSCSEALWFPLSPAA